MSLGCSSADRSPWHRATVRGGDTSGSRGLAWTIWLTMPDAVSVVGASVGLEPDRCVVDIYAESWDALS